MAQLYDTIGLDYANLRKADSRIAARVDTALGDAQTILNVGAGAGSYEPINRQVTAVEPSWEMIKQRQLEDGNVIQACAEKLPFSDKVFDASMAILTMHHWSDQSQGIQELKRVTRDKIVILTFDPNFRGFWLTDYFPELIKLDVAQMPLMKDFSRWFGSAHISPVMIPHDCQDGFLAAYWRRPALYLDEKIRAAISPFRMLENISGGLEKLAGDLKSGEWERKNRQLLSRDEMDCGYRLIEINI